MSNDTISLVGIVVYGYHGARPEERSLGQRFVIDVDLDIDLRTPCTSDDLSDTVNYSEVYRIVNDVIGDQSVNLLETLAGKIADRLLSGFPKADVAHVRIAKPGVAISGAILRESAIRITRSRSDL
jgi:dihydroneopterin aldolase